MTDRDRRTVAYRRISGAPAQFHGHSLEEDQPREIRALASAHGLEIVEWFKDEQSGSTNIRPGLMGMLDYCVKHSVRNVVAFRFDRLSRAESMIERGLLLNALTENKIVVYTTDKVFDPANYPADILNYEVVSAVSADALRALRERIKASWRTRIARCLYSPGRRPFGFQRVNEVAEDGRKVTMYLPDPEEAAIVREIYTRFIDGESACAIAQDLTNRQVPKDRGETWLDTLVARIIDNPAYAGFFRPRKSPDQLLRALNIPEPIVPLTIWNDAGVVRQSRHRFQRRQKTSGSVLSGLMVCASCGSPMQCKGSHGDVRWWRELPERGDDGSIDNVVRQVSSAKYYQCSLAVSSNYVQCGERTVREDTVIDALLDIGMVVLLMHQSKVLHERHDNRSEDVEAEYQQVRLARERLLTQFEKGNLLDSDFEERIVPMNQRIQELAMLARQHPSGFVALDPYDVIALCRVENHPRLRDLLRQAFTEIRCRDRRPVQMRANIEVAIIDDGIEVVPAVGEPVATIDMRVLREQAALDESTARQAGEPTILGMPVLWMPPQVLSKHQHSRG